MINYQSGDLVLVDFPLTTGGIGKLRPAMVVLDTGDADVLVARVTTQSHASPFDVAITEWKAAGLLAPSTVRLHKLASLAKGRIQRVLGAIVDPDRRRIANALQQIPAAW